MDTENLKKALTSKKFWVMCAAVLTILGTAISGEQAWAVALPEILGVVVAWLIAQGLADNGEKRANPPK